LDDRKVNLFSPVFTEAYNMALRFRIVLLYGAVLLPLAACGVSSTETTGSAANSDEDAKFADRAPVELLQGLTFARLAETKASDEGVRRFAATMEHDYDTIDHQLTPQLQEIDMQQPSGMDGRHQVLYVQLQTYKGRAFDRTYLGDQLEDQTTMIEVFQAEADSGKKPTLQKLAQASLPALLSDLRSADQLSQDR
jgi:predicted outer membrane protein